MLFHPGSILRKDVATKGTKATKGECGGESNGVAPAEARRRRGKEELNFWADLRSCKILPERRRSCHLVRIVHSSLFSQRPCASAPLQDNSLRIGLSQDFAGRCSLQNSLPSAVTRKSMSGWLDSVLPHASHRWSVSTGWFFLPCVWPSLWP